MSLNAA
jgi:hypothetical protein